jgi:DNA helicase-2/ATP-dependent DNA helicase PcrA
MEVSSQQSGIAKYNDHLYVVAIPGSGKTRTLVAKIIFLRSTGVKKIVILTFTRSAANELIERMDTAFPMGHSFVKIGTFHSIISEHLNKYSDLPMISLEEQATYLHRIYFREFGEYNMYESFETYFDNYHSGTIKKTNDVYDKLIREYYETVVEKKGNSITNLISTGQKMIEEMKVPLLDCEWLMIDEFQDVDVTQTRFVIMHGLSSIKIVAVGDDDQSIYNWRGASGVKSFNQIERVLNAKKFILETNYRSHEEILGKATLLISHNKTRIEKRMISKKGTGGELSVFEFDTAFYEALWIANEVQKFHGKEVAVITRTNARLDVIEDILIEKGVKYIRKGANNRLNGIAVKIYITVLIALESRNKDSLESAIEPIIHDPKLAHKYSHKIFSSEVSPSDFKNPAHFDFIEGLIKAYEFISCGVFKDAINTLAFSVMTQANKMGMSETYEIENVAHRLVKMKGSLVGRIALLQIQKSSKSDIELMTAHGSKGLEKDVVFISGCSDKIFPLRTNKSDQFDIEEERRLFFVGMTRAKWKLYLTMYKGTDNKPNYYSTSQFITEMEIDNDNIMYVSRGELSV